MKTSSLSTETIQSLRLLSNQMISKAGSGHPGIALGAAPILYELYANQLNVDPENPNMINRDRFILSAGHGAALLYATLHAAGFDLSAQDLSEFRQPHSKTPGHPEVGVTPGVEATTGPLGQGLGMAVGMAMAEAKLKNQFPSVIDHFTFALVGDGDLMEGVSHEVASLAGQQKLGKLVVLYDDNAVSLDGLKKRSDISNNLARFASYGWDIREVADGNDLEAIHDAIENAKMSPEPTLIAVKTIIGDFGPFAGTNKAHGTPLDSQQLQDLSSALDVDIQNFELPSNLLEDMRAKISNRLLHQKQPLNDELTDYLQFSTKNTVIIPELPTDLKVQAGRKISKYVLQNFATQLPQLWGGSADLVASTNAEVVASLLFNADDRSVRNIAFGVREFGMGAVMNGIALHGGTKVFGATFLAFSDYMKAAIRLSALQHVPSIYVFTHDSITVGEDGPTHQPVEQLMGLRLIPGVDVLRPGTAEEIASAWQRALTSTDRPTILILSRGEIGAQGSTDQAKQSLENGAAQIRHHDEAKINLIATGSEVQIAQKVSELLSLPSNVVSMPNLSRFLALDDDKKQQIIPETGTKNVIIEAGTTLGWQGIAGNDGVIFGIDEFGMSAAAQIALDEFGFNAEDIVDKITQELQ